MTHAAEWIVGIWLGTNLGVLAVLWRRWTNEEQRRAEQQRRERMWRAS
jgi:hypothetical protein